MMLDVNRVYKTFHPGTINERRALAGVDLHLEEGDFVTVIGGNGAGEILCAFVDTFAGTQFVSFAWLMSGVFSSFAVVPFVTARFKRREEELFAASREAGNPAPHTDENKTTQECPHSKRK